MRPSFLNRYLDFKLFLLTRKLWVELYLRIESQRNGKEGNGKVFREKLDKSERKVFDGMMSFSRLYNVAGVGSCKPVLLHSILMSIIFEHFKQLKK